MKKKVNINTDDRFRFAGTFEMTVPKNYDHVTQLASFRERSGGNFCLFSENITDINFAKVTDKLLPDRTYEVRMFQVTKSASLSDCLQFLKTQNAILTGAQGLSLLWQLKKTDLPIEKFIISIDEESALWKDTDGDYRVPSMLRSPGDWEGNFVLVDVKGDCYLACFSDADAAKLAGVQADISKKFKSGQITLSHLKWFNKLTKPERDLLSDDRFKLLEEFELTVPNDYDHATQLASFRKNNGKDFYYCNKDITDKNFTRVTDKLVPGRIYTVKIFQELKSMHLDDELEFLKNQNAILVGAQGLSLLWQLKKAEFSAGKWTGKYLISNDEKSALLKNASDALGTPSIDLDSKGHWFFDLAYREYSWTSADCLLCFCEA